MQVLLLLPLRSTALRWVSRLLRLAQAETRADSIQHKQRFLDEFGEPDSGERIEDGGAAHDAGVDGVSRKGGKPAEHEALFSGNGDDHFRLGIRITRCGRRVSLPCPCCGHRTATCLHAHVRRLLSCGPRSCLRGILLRRTKAGYSAAQFPAEGRRACYNMPRSGTLQPASLVLHASLGWVISVCAPSLVPRGAIKLYADFLQSDIIVASPIALATLLAEAPDQARQAALCAVLQPNVVG